MLILLFNEYLNVPIIYRELPTAGTGDTREGELAVLPNPSLLLNSRAAATQACGTWAPLLREWDSAGQGVYFLGPSLSRSG